MATGWPPPGGRARWAGGAGAGGVRRHGAGGARWGEGGAGVRWTGGGQARWQGRGARRQEPGRDDKEEEEGNNAEMGKQRGGTQCGEGGKWHDPPTRSHLIEQSWLALLLSFIYNFKLHCMYICTNPRKASPSLGKIYLLYYNMCDELCRTRPTAPSAMMTCFIYRTHHPMYPTAIHPILLLNSQLNGRLSYY